MIINNFKILKQLFIYTQYLVMDLIIDTKIAFIYTKRKIFKNNY